MTCGGHINLPAPEPLWWIMPLTIDDEDGIEQADEFAKRLAQIEREWPESDMVKYHVV